MNARVEKVKILYVGDEANNLVGFKATFRNEFQVLTALTEEEGLAILNNTPDVAVVLSDSKLQESTGVDFLETVTERFPRPVRMLLTAYADVNTIISAINRGHIFRYITLPWTEAEIRSAIEEGYRYYVTSAKLHEKDEALEKAYQDLDKFAYSVTHDVRGPIISLLGALQAILESDNINEIYKWASMMVESVVGLDNFVLNMHDYYSLKQGDLAIQEIDFQALAQKVFNSFQAKAKKEAVDFQVSVDQESDFRSDERLLLLIFNNLLSNAFQFQSEGSKAKFVRLGIEVKKGLASLVVVDNGIGIHEFYHKDVFNMFFRATPYNSGAGIGLYNVKDALRKLGGEIHLTSTLGEGSTFRLLIPSK